MKNVIWILFAILCLGVAFEYLFKTNHDDELKWESKSQNFALSPGVITHHTSFHFKNVSQHPITIETIKPDCNCLVPQLAVKTIDPGASGQIDVTFNPGDRSGELNRSIEVRTKEFPNHPVILKLTYHIPELVRISHRLLFWKIAETPAPQEIDLTMPDEPIKVTGARSSSRDFSFKIVPISEGKEYKVLVTPQSLAIAHQSVLLIDTDYPHAPWNRIVANLKIQ